MGESFVWFQVSKLGAILSDSVPTHEILPEALELQSFRVSTSSNKGNPGELRSTCQGEKQ